MNLTLPLGLLLGIGESNNDYGKQLHHDLIKIHPFVLATSFHVEQDKRNFKSEYVISQLIMHCLKGLGIDGVAYMSTKAKGEMDFPLNVCLALPVFDEKEFDKNFEITEPMLLEKFIKTTDKNTDKKRSFINKYYENKPRFIVDVSDVPRFKNSVYSAFDDYLVARIYKGVNAGEGEGEDQA